MDVGIQYSYIHRKTSRKKVPIAKEEEKKKAFETRGSEEQTCFFSVFVSLYQSLVNLWLTPVWWYHLHDCWTEDW